MTLDPVRTLCRSFPAVTEDIKWDGDLVFSVGAKMFAVVMLDPPHRLSFKCDPEQWAELVEREGIIPAPYLARAKWVSIESLHDGPDWREVAGWLRRSYDLVRAGLPKRLQAELKGAPERTSAKPASPTRSRPEVRAKVARPRRR